MRANVRILLQAYADFDGNSPRFSERPSGELGTPPQMPSTSVHSPLHLSTPPPGFPAGGGQEAVSPELHQAMRSSIAQLEAKLEGALEGVTEDFAAEVGREQQHLMLMQVSTALALPTADHTKTVK